MTYDVIVVGGGMAGLAAAHTLTHLGRKVALLEASHHLGGRVFNLALEKGSSHQHLTQQHLAPQHLTYQAGALSIQGETQMVNPLHAILQRHHIKTKPLSSLQAETFDSAGNKISLATLHHSLIPEYNKALMRIQEAKQLHWTNPPLLAEVLNYYNKPAEIPEIDSPAYWARKFITASIIQHTGASLDEVSLLELMQDEWGSEENHIIVEGTDKLTDALFKEANATKNLTLLLNTKVVKVQQWDELSLKHIADHSEAGANILVFDNKERRYSAKTVIIAVPFAVLKHHKIIFFPELSRSKQNALHHFGVSHYNSVILEFENVFWDKEAHYLFPNGPKIEDWPQYLNGYYFFKDKNPVLIVQFSGKKARFSDKTDQAIVEEALEPLKRVYGERVTPLKSFYVSRYDTDPNILGGSLYCSKQNRKEDFEALKKPEKGCYFAGDYTYSKRHGRLESAFESGLQAGLEADVYLHYKEDLQRAREEHLRPKF